MTQEPTSKPAKSIAQPLGSPIGGATYPFRAFWFFVKHPDYRVYILMPILINLVVGITVYAGLLLAGLRAIDHLIATLPTWAASTPGWSVPTPEWHLTLPAWFPTWQLSLPTWSNPLPAWHFQLPDWLTQAFNWRPTLPDWLAALPGWGAIVFVWLLRLVLTIVLLIVTGFIFLQFGVLLGAPWYGKLSEKLEMMRTGHLVSIEVGILRDIGRAISYELKKLVLAVGVGIPLLILGLFPGIGTFIASVGGVVVAATLVCLDFLDSPLERRRLRFRQKLAVIWRSLPASAMFGLVCLGLVSIPLINLLAIPLCVTAGTLFVCDRVLPQLPTSSREL